MKICSIRSFYLLFLVACIGVSVQGQARLILNGAKMNIANGANLVIQNGASNAMTRIDGHIISEGELNGIKWVMGNSTGTYTLPWGYGEASYIPLSFTKAAGTGSGYFTFSTYHTGWENSLYLPAGVTKSNNGDLNLSAFIIDRYWQINALDYTVKPDLTSVGFTYLEAEHTVAQNTIDEGSFAVQRWSDDTDTWQALVTGSSVNASTNVVTVANIGAADLDPWWTLAMGQAILPVQFLLFDAKLKDHKTRLTWTTQEELNIIDFDVQRSVDGRDYNTIGTVSANSTAGKNDYLFFDEKLQPGKLFYRIRENGKNGSYTYSETRTVMINADQMLSVYPNPVSGKKIMLNTTALLPGQYHVSLFDLKGKLVFQSSQMFNRTIVPLQLDAVTAKGTYLLKIVGGQSVFNKVILID